MTLGARIRRRLDALGWKQTELARRTGIAQTTINSLVNGNARSTPHLVKIAHTLQTSPAFLTGETDDDSIDAAAVSITDRDRQWLDLMHSLSPRDQNAVLVLARTLAGVSEERASFAPPPAPVQTQVQSQTLHTPRQEYRGQ